MTRYLILNELSFSSPAANENEARTRMVDLLGTIMSAEDLGVDGGIRMHDNFYSEVLSPNYTIGSWCIDDLVDLETRRYFYSLATHIPFLDDLNETGIKDKFFNAEFYFGSQISMGLGIAYLMDCMALSLNSHAQWNQHELTLDMNFIDENNNIAKTQISVLHAALPAHVQQNSIWISSALQRSVSDGADLLNRQARLLPALIFCGNTARVLSDLNPSDPLFNQIIKRLFELQTYCHNWTAGPFDVSLMSSKTNSESSATLHQYEADHQFTCPDGSTYSFSWHVYLTPGPWRIYFVPLVEIRGFLIGHIGRKLPSVSYGYV